MSRIKGRYVGQIIITIDVPRKKTDFPIAEIKENFRQKLTKGLQEELQSQMEDLGTIELDEQYLDVYEVTE